MNSLFKEKRYRKFKTELKICKIGGLFLALSNNKEVPELIIKKLRDEDDLEGILQFPLYMDETKVPFPILFEQTFEQMGNKNNIYHVLGIEENLSSEAAKEFLGYLQYARERFKAKPYSLVFWITPEFEKELFFQAPDFHHWIFGTYDFTDIGEEELQSLTSSETNELFDVLNIDKYLEKVILQYQNWELVKKNNESFLLEPMERADLYNYYVQSYCIDKEGKEQLLDYLLDNFIEDKKQNFLTLLGDFGTGKSSFSIHYFVRLAQKYLDDKTKRIPIFISLKDYRGKLNIENFMVKKFYDKFNIKINFSIFQQLALEGKFIFFVDGFDEMASLTDREITIQNLKELTKLSFENILFMTKSQDKNYQANKVFLTSRTHYFLTESQERNILKADYTVLYRNYATKSHYEITRIKLKEFNEDQIREYIQKYTNNEEITNQYLKIIEDTYNLQELSTRPLLLDMIVKTMPRLKEKKNINPAALYREYTNIWIERDDWRSHMTSEGKRNFIWEMAVNMFKIGGDFSLHYSRLDPPKDEHLKPNFHVSDQDYYKYESTTCSFLNRDSAGNYKFIHKSFMEYFVAESFYWHLSQDNTRILEYSSLNNEIKFFFKNIIALDKDQLDALDLSNLDLSQIDLSSGSLNGTNLEGVNLSGTNLRNTTINEQTNLDDKWRLVWTIVNQGAKEQNLSSGDLSNANLKYADLSNANLRYADLSNANLSYTNLSYADLRANLKGANLDYANLSYANLSSIIINGNNLSHAALSHANLRDSYLADSKLSCTNLNSADLSGVNLSRAILSYAIFSNAKLSDANLNDACLISADLSDANLSDANLSGANLSSANFSGTNLSGANLSSANLSSANFSGTNLSGANLSSANFSGADLSSANLSGTKLSGANFSGTYIISNKYIIYSQIKSTCFWDQAFYKGYWDHSKSKWKIDKQANQKYIEQLKIYRATQNIY